MANTAIVCAGQGAQFPGMGKDLADKYPECAAIFSKADEVLGYELSKICFEGPAEELTKSNHCQPAIFVATAACFEALKQEKGEVEMSGLAGLSLGEWSALYLGGAVSLENAIRVLEARGRFMQEACDERDGAMVSVIGLAMENITEICSQTGAQISNLNSGAQVVISGERAAVEEADRQAQAAGAKKTVMLNVAGAYHSPLMASAAEKLEGVLADVEMNEPSIPVLSNVTGKPHGDVVEMKANMVRQVTETVRWLSCIEWFMGNGIDTYVECGPGRVLSGLIKRIDRSVTINNIQDLGSLEKLVNG